MNLSGQSHVTRLPEEKACERFFAGTTEIFDNGFVYLQINQLPWETVLIKLRRDSIFIPF